MKLRTTLLPAILSIVFMVFGACSGDDSDDGPDNTMGCADFTAEWEAAVNAASAYTQNPTTANCEAYKAALTDFYEEYSDCPFWGGQYQDALDEVQQMDCSEADNET